jgi:hypothetical protein
MDMYTRIEKEGKCFDLFSSKNKGVLSIYR